MENIHESFINVFITIKLLSNFKDISTFSLFLKNGRNHSKKGWLLEKVKKKKKSQVLKETSINIVC